MDEAKLKQKLIKNFIKSNSDMFDKFQVALDEGDIVLAHRLMHTLKSNAAQLDKTMLLQLAEDIEEYLKDGMNLVTLDQVTKLQDELDKVLTELKTAVTEQIEPEIKKPKKTSNKTLILELINELEPMLMESNTDCIERIDTFRLIPDSDLLIRQIEGFDFSDATETLAAIKAKWME